MRPITGSSWHCASLLMFSTSCSPVKVMRATPVAGSHEMSGASSAGGSHPSRSRSAHDWTGSLVRLPAGPLDVGLVVGVPADEDADDGEGWALGTLSSEPHAATSAAAPRSTPTCRITCRQPDVASCGPPRQATRRPGDDVIQRHCCFGLATRALPTGRRAPAADRQRGPFSLGGGRSAPHLAGTTSPAEMKRFSAVLHEIGSKPFTPAGRSEVLSQWMPLIRIGEA